MSNDFPIEQLIAQQLPEAMALQLHILPAHQELIAPLPTGYVGPVMAAAEQWLKVHGYRTLGPWMIAWGPTGQPQLRRPVSGALKAIREKDFQTVEVPEQLLLAVPFVGWPVLPHNFTQPVNSVGLNIMGSPMLLALTDSPPTMAWVPVVPRGTNTLFSIERSKIGLLPTPPKAGRQVPMLDAWLRASYTLGRFLTILVSGFGFLMSISVIFSLLIGDIDLSSIQSLSFILAFQSGILAVLSSQYLIIPLIIVFSVIGAYKMNAIANWNRFWQQRPTPPELLLGSRGDGKIGTWLG
ncbi:hypothetical protein ACP8Y2_19975 [Herpetosiphon llansteffanensis]